MNQNVVDNDISFGGGIHQVQRHESVLVYKKQEDWGRSMNIATNQTVKQLSLLGILLTFTAVTLQRRSLSFVICFRRSVALSFHFYGWWRHSREEVCVCVCVCVCARARIGGGGKGKRAKL